MDKRDQHLNRLKIAEQQFRLACTVNLAVANRVQMLDVPVVWTFGRYQVSYEDFGLRADQAEWAACHLELTSTLVIAAAIRDAIVALFENPKCHTNPDVVAAYQISRMIRNAFAHSMIYSQWSIDSDCRDRIFEIKDVIKLETPGLADQPLEWRHYGGPLAIFHLGRFVRLDLLRDTIDPHREKPAYPTIENYQQGRLILRKLDQLPDGAVQITLGPGDSLDFGGGTSSKSFQNNCNPCTYLVCDRGDPFVTTPCRLSVSRCTTRCPPASDPRSFVRPESPFLRPDPQ